MIIRKVIEETRAKMFRRWNIAMFNEAVKVGKEESPQHNDDRLDQIIQHTRLNLLEAFSETMNSRHTNLCLSSGVSGIVKWILAVLELHRDAYKLGAP